MRVKSLLAFFCLLLLSACAGTPREEFARRDEKEISYLVGDVNQAAQQPWLGFVFDIEVVAGGKALTQSNNPGGDAKLGTHVLMRPNAIGNLNGVKHVQVSTGLWQESSLGKEKAHAVVDLNLVSGTVDPDTSEGSLKARIVCEEWAQGFAVRQGKFPEARLREALKKNWSENKKLPVRFALPPYKVGAYWVVPVEVELSSPNFEDHCL